MPRPRSDDAPGDEIALVIEAMYQIAADPDRWDQLVEALGEAEPTDDIPQAARMGLAQSREIARLVGRADEAVATKVEPAWLVLSRRRKVIAAGPTAAAVLEAGLGRLVLGEAVAFEDPANGWALDQAMDRVRQQPEGQTILRLERDDERGPCFAYLAPASRLPELGGRPAAVEDDQAVALVFPAAEEAARLWTGLRDSFGLTPAEVRLARKLRDGRSLKDAADELAVSVNTVRNQLRAVFEKMGLKRQSDLVRALAELSQMARLMEAGAARSGGGPASPPLETLILADGRRLSYRAYGARQDRVVLMFHEGLGSSLLPPGLADHAQGLGVRVICADRPGFGGSDPHPDYSFDNVAADMVELCDRLGVDQVAIGAMLSGAPSALQTAVRLGARARGVLLISGRPPRPALPDGPQDPINLFRLRIESHPWVVETLYSILRLRISASLVRRFVRSSVAGSPGDQAFVEANPWTVDYVAAYVTEALSATTQGAADELKAFRRARNMTLAGLTAPLKIWHGEEDQFAPLPALMDFVGDRAREVKIIPGTGHFLALRFWREILDELAQAA
ncbi:alpha/beta fold hydrolase [Phenylobacterium aquaticum]|uniref:alpha/beta fold hydrolase n=1 Tax=Phenylobacterium aquaticum TaxID=1763816 RepID=UPI0026ECA73E|nr:alpha/beta fold hydrolase [Phenylobacterium aquaticum]